jgi:acyl dehydratase
METSASPINEEELARLRSRIGEVVEIEEYPYLTEVTRDAVRHWALATGDRNQLYFDDEFASRSSFGRIVAPPCLPYAFSRLSIGYRGGLPGVHSMFGGSHWRWFKPAAVGTRVRHETRFEDLIELQGRFAGRMFRQVSVTRFWLDEDKDAFAEVRGWGMRVERGAARERRKYAGLARVDYTADLFNTIAAEYRKEYVRGNDFLYWDDVRVGERTPTIVRGPYTATTAVAFEQAWGGLFIHAHGYWFDFLRQHPAAGLANSRGIPEPPEAVHWDSELARSVGVPDAYDYGPERISWMATMLTNWIGNHGFLQELYCEIRGFNLLGDVTHCRGEVEECVMPVAMSEGKVRLKVWAENQRGDTTAKGWAIVRLPMREPSA